MSRRLVPFFINDSSLINNEFRRMRDLFFHQMRAIEEDMFKITSEMTKYDANKTIASRNVDETNTTTPLTSWLNKYRNPLVHQEGDAKTFKLQFNLNHFKPEEVKLSIIDNNRLKVEAKHEEKDDKKSFYSEYSEEFTLPEGVNAEEIKSTLNKEGVLTIEASIRDIEKKEQVLAIEFEK